MSLFSRPTLNVALCCLAFGLGVGCSKTKQENNGASGTPNSSSTDVSGTPNSSSTGVSGTPNSSSTNVLVRLAEEMKKPLDEDPEVARYFKDKGWAIHRDVRFADNAGMVYLTIEAPGGKRVALTPDDSKMIARSKAITMLDLRKADMDDEGLRAISGIPTLEDVVVWGGETSKLTPAGIKTLAAIPKLHALWLMFVKIDDSTFEPFAKSETLRELHMEHVDGLNDVSVRPLADIPHLDNLTIKGGFGENKLTSAGIGAIVKKRCPAEFEFDTKLLDDDLLEALVAKGWLYGPSPPDYARKKRPASAQEVEWIALSDSKVTDKGMQCLMDCKNVRSMHVNNTGITDATLKKMSDWKDLAYLSLDKTKVGAEGLAALASLPIKHLSLVDCELTEQTFQAIGKISALEELWLANSRMKADWIKHLAGLSKLKDLNLSGADFDDAAAVYVAKLPNLDEITLNSTNLGDTGFQILVALPKLKKLWVDSTKVSKDVYLKAKRENPKKNFYFYRYEQEK
jgi:hypothetical protein